MNRDTPESRVLDAVVEEARARLEPRERDWARLEARIAARVVHEGAPLARDAKASALRSRVVLATSALLAAAAVAVLVVPREGDSALLESASPISSEPPVAGALRSTTGEGEVKIAGVVATAGHALRAGDAVEVTGTSALFERPRKVTWLLEGSEGAAAARARVKSAGETLVLGLEEGAIEAQVAPVATGEAFAVDVATEQSIVRVAVHGTHLRVARAGTKIVVDLSEGVVSIGTPPRVGATYGTLVTAPAHVELDAQDPVASLKVDHAAASVRAPASLVANESVLAMKDPPPQAAAGRGALAAPPSKGQAPHPESANPPPTKAPKGMPTVPARDLIAAAVRECAREKGRPSEVKVTVNSVLRLKVQGGAILSAQFDPPLAPEIQACVTPAIYKSKMDEQGIVTIPVEFSY